jgi:hypothetical protein
MKRNQPEATRPHERRCDCNTTSAHITGKQAVSSLTGRVVLASIGDVDCLACLRKDDSARWLGQYMQAVLLQPATAVADGEIASERPADTGSTFSATLAASLMGGFSLSLSCLAACFCAAPGGRASGPILTFASLLGGLSCEC